MSTKVNIHQNNAKEAYEYLIKDTDLVIDVDFTVQKFVGSNGIEFTFEKSSDAVQFKLLYG